MWWVGKGDGGGVEEITREIHSEMDQGNDATVFTTKRSPCHSLDLHNVLSFTLSPLALVETLFNTIEQP